MSLSAFAAGVSTSPAIELPSFGHGNAKLPSSTMTFALPAGFTCPGASLCLATANPETGCITDGPDQLFRCSSASEETRPSVRKARWRNHRIIHETPADQLGELLALAVRVQMRRYSSHVRWFTSGDCHLIKLRDAIIAAAQATPTLTHYLYSKNLPIWLTPCGTQRLELPANLFLTASWGGRHDHLIEAGLFDRTARVVNTEEEALELGLAVDFTDQPAWDPVPTHFCHLVHGSQPAGSAAMAAISARKKAGSFSGYSRKPAERRIIAGQLSAA